jgi:TolA-binding protein
MDRTTDRLEAMLQSDEAKAAQLREAIKQRQEEIEQLQKELDHTEQAIFYARETQKRLSRFQRQVQELGAQLPGAETPAAPAPQAARPPEPPGTQPTISQMIIQTLEASGRPLTRAMIHTACQQQGWTVKYTSLSPTLSYLVKGGHITRVREGWYEFPR